MQHGGSFHDSWPSAVWRCNKQLRQAAEHAICSHISTTNALYIMDIYKCEDVSDKEVDIAHRTPWFGICLNLILEAPTPASSTLASGI
jgi:hypothetical protein